MNERKVERGFAFPAHVDKRLTSLSPLLALALMAKY